MIEVETRTTLLRRVADPTDNESWREFRALYEPLLLWWLKNRGLDDNDAHDVKQNIWIKLLRALPEFEYDRRRARFRTWLYRIVRHEWAQWLRDSGGRRAIGANANDDRLAQVPDETSDEEDEWRDAHKRRVFEFILDRVRSEERPERWTCFEKCFLQGRPGQEVASELGIKRNLVFQHIHRVKERIRQMCLEYEEELDDE